MPPPACSTSSSTPAAPSNRIGSRCCRSWAASIPRHARCAWSSSTSACARPASPTTSSPIPTSTTQPWRIDLVPLILGVEEWRALERALIQRARLFEAILADLYGPQQLLTSGAIPHQLVFSDPSFLRPCHDIRPHKGFIQFFATDLARGPDGRLARDRHARRDAGRHRLCARQPHGAHQRRRRHVRRLQCAAAGAVLPAAAGRARAPRRPRRSGNRPADAGSAPQRLLQPRLPRPLPRPDAGGRRRPARHRRPRLAQDAARPDAGRPDRALRGRRRRRPAGARLLGLRGARRACCRPCAGIPTSSPTRWARRSPRTAA